MRPLRVLQETLVATREESGVLGFISRRGLTSLAPHERLPEVLVVPREKTPMSALLSSRDTGLLEHPERPQGSPASSSVWRESHLRDLTNVSCIGRQILYHQAPWEAKANIFTLILQIWKLSLK